MEAVPDFDVLPIADAVRTVRTPLAPQFYASMVRFASGGWEISARCVDKPSKPPMMRCDLGGGYRLPPEGGQTDQSLRRSMHRRRRGVRHQVKNFGATHLFTLTTRAVLPRAELVKAWARVCRYIDRLHPNGWHYVCVPEPHPSNPDHWHLHVAIAMFMPANLVRRFWHLALGAPGLMHGKDAPGNVDLQQIKNVGGGGVLRRSVKIARYISKYVTKSDDVTAFNKKRYFCSRSSRPQVEKFWLAAGHQGAAFSEIVGKFFWSTDSINEDVFLSKDGNVVWVQYVPGSGTGPPEPPF
jgi:hypothetical protein